MVNILLYFSIWTFLLHIVLKQDIYLDNATDYLDQGLSCWSAWVACALPER